jgi:hypothetical protein
MALLRSLISLLPGGILVNWITGRIKSGVIVVIFPDRGEKYLTTTLFDVK